MEGTPIHNIVGADSEITAGDRNSRNHSDYTPEIE
jgi:hypothetical protein